MTTQNVSVTEQQAISVKELVDSGMFKTVSEVHRAALSDFVDKVKMQQSKLNHLDSLIDQGREGIDSGRCSSFESDDELDDIFIDIEQRAKTKYLINQKENASA